MNGFKVVVISCLLIISATVNADSGIWSTIKHSQRNSTQQQLSDHFYRVDKVELRQQLSRANHEGRSKTTSQIELPVNNGSIQRFKLEESPVMAAGLAAKFPEIKSYKVYGIDNPFATGRISISPKGFHGMITDPSGTYYIDPSSDDTYRTYSKKSKNSSQPFKCGVKGHNHDAPVTGVANRPAQRTAGSLRVYRLAVAATSEYVTAVGGTTDSALSEINNAINRVNLIYERDLAIRLEIIDRNDEILYTSASDPYTNNDGFTMLDENQQNLDQVIGSANYDIGHVFSTGGGGIADVGSVCSSAKAGGVTGLLNPVGESFYIDYVAHEIGHQFNAEHTFNGTAGSCGSGNRWSASAFEPGSGSTIMSYAGICGSESIAGNSDALFHAGSIDLIDTFTTSGLGQNCGVLQSISNANEPLVDAGNDYNIPRKTPFVLTATGSDSDGDDISYSWSQMDAGTATSSSTLGTDLGDNALFRSYLPQADNSRHFPALGTTLQNEFDDSENLPCLTRDLNFRVSVRDGNSGLGKDNLRLSVDNDSGPFQITSFNESQAPLTLDTYTLNWDVANTDIAPVNCSSVDISLLTFNTAKTTYAETLLAVTEANDGSATVTIPDNSNAQSRFKIQCSDNVFYDISDADLIITGSTAFETSGKNVFYNSDGLLLNSSSTESCSTGSGGPGDESNDDFSSADIITFSSIYNYGIQYSNDVDFFRFTVPALGTVNVYTIGTTDTLCALYADASGSNLLAYDDDSGAGLNCVITQELETGTYSMSIEGALLETVGDYGLTVTYSASNEGSNPSESGSSESSSSGGAVSIFWLINLFMIAFIRKRLSI